jgi:hypothetical protein
MHIEPIHPPASPLIEPMFVSNNVRRVRSEVMCAIGTAVAYCGDEASNDLARAFSGYFEPAVAALRAGTGTAANALALAFATPRFASMYCGHDLVGARPGTTRPTPIRAARPTWNSTTAVDRFVTATCGQAQLGGAA